LEQDGSNMSSPQKSTENEILLHDSRGTFLWSQLYWQYNRTII